MICTTFNDIRITLSDLYYVEWFVLRWKIWTTLNDLYSVELFVVRWMNWTTLHDLHNVELFVAQRWMICTTLNDLYYVEWFVPCWMIVYVAAKFVPPRMTCTAKELYSVERFVLHWRFGVRWMTCTTLNHLDYDWLLSTF